MLDVMVNLDARKLDVLQALLFAQHPALPVGGAVRHASEDDLRYLEPGVSEADCAWLLSATHGGKSHAVCDN